MIYLKFSYKFFWYKNFFIKLKKFLKKDYKIIWINMSNRSSSKQHGHAQSQILRPKSKLRWRRNKANLAAARIEKNENLAATVAKAETALKSEF